VWQPIGLIARVDRGYRLKGELHLAEFKTRTHAVVYSSDVIELSAQRLVIEKSTGERRGVSTSFSWSRRRFFAFVGSSLLSAVSDGSIRSCSLLGHGSTKANRELFRT
jgi:hypothetical protein